MSKNRNVAAEESVITQINSQLKNNDVRLCLDGYYVDFVSRLFTLAEKKYKYR